MMDQKEQIMQHDKNKNMMQQQNDLAQVRGAIQRETSDTAAYRDKFLKFNIGMNERNERGEIFRGPNSPQAKHARP